MGYIYIDFILRGKVSKNVRTLVDAGSAYIVLDPKTISEIGLLEIPFNVKLTLADKGKLKQSFTWLRWKPKAGGDLPLWRNSMFQHQ